MFALLAHWQETRNKRRNLTNKELPLNAHAELHHIYKSLTTLDLKLVRNWCLCCSTPTPSGFVVRALANMEKVSFGASGATGYEAGPKDRPAVVVLQEWWGKHGRTSALTIALGNLYLVLFLTHHGVVSRGLQTCHYNPVLCLIHVFHTHTMA